MSKRLHFRPLPLLGNAHVQTVLANVLPGPRENVPSELRLVSLPDGDQLALHDSIPDGWRPGDPVTLLVHGLGGTHRSSYLLRMMSIMRPKGVRVVRMDLRGAGQGLTLARRSYHAGCSDDVRAVLMEIERWCPGSPILLAGFSLGGNIVLKLAGEAADRPVPGLARIAAVNPPIDLLACAQRLGLPGNRLYEKNFLRELVASVRHRQHLFPDLPRTRFPRNLTLPRFDDLWTAPAWGFADALEYYRESSSLPLIPRIQVPTLILTSRDDPLVAPEPFETLAPPAHVEVHIVPRGGHLGYLGWDGAGGIRWGERQVAGWLLNESANS